MSVRSNLQNGYIANQKDSLNRVVHELRELQRAVRQLTITSGSSVGLALETTLQSVLTTLNTYSTDAGAVDANTLRVQEATRDTAHTFSSTSTTGNATGFKSISILNSGSAAGTVDGVAFPAGASMTLPFNPNGVYSNPISWNATGTTFLISIIN